MDYYNILGINKKASSSEIKKAYRKLAMKHHPDKGGDVDKFKEINKVYETLSDPEKKKMYDQFGENGPNVNMGRGMGPDFSNMFHMFQGQQRQKRPTIHHIKVSLQDLYFGITKKLKFIRNLECKICSGKGGKNVTKCLTCHGRGFVFLTKTFGLNMIQRVQIACTKCKKGYIVTDKCKPCKGIGTISNTQILEIKIDKGMKNGDKILLKQAGNQTPGSKPEDVIVVIQQINHVVFQRKNDNLYMKRKISLLNSLTGFQFILDHFDSKIKITSENIINPGEIKVVHGKGMPNKYGFGDLCILFEITFPDNLITDKILLSKILCQKNIDVKPNKYTEYVLDYYQGSDDDNHADNHHEHEHPEAGCATQ